jgi:hypothetical protein
VSFGAGHGQAGELEGGKYFFFACLLLLHGRRRAMRVSHPSLCCILRNAGDGNNMTHSWLRLAAVIPYELVCICPPGVLSWL